VRQLEFRDRYVKDDNRPNDDGIVEAKELDDRARDVK
jgi:hypothetical protein